MPALPADLAAGTRPAVIVQWRSPGVQSDWPDARDQLTEPAWGAFDDPAHALAALAIKGALIGVGGRGRFAVSAHALVFVDPAADGIPTYHVIDAEVGANQPGMLCRIEIDPNTETTQMEILG